MNYSVCCVFSRSVSCRISSDSTSLLLVTLNILSIPLEEKKLWLLSGLDSCVQTESYFFIERGERGPVDFLPGLLGLLSPLSMPSGIESILTGAALAAGVLSG